MSTVSSSKFFGILATDIFSSKTPQNPPKVPNFFPSLYPKLPSCLHLLAHHASRKSLTLVSSKSSGSSEELSSASPEDEWLKKLPDKKKPLYSHSLPCIEAWLRNLGFNQSKEDRAVWLVEKPEWHAQLSLDVTDLYIRYLKSGPGNLEKDVERRFSYALSREDIENAVLGGP
ncbi:uncharacterized protein LOC121255605 [Juglans microcarpa x Juglans regia]|uniref:uncharacterized protein LOC121255605 n=1 Tax=Juglans microcarpa x Juglans regia TaxID=2249226 RepID=UPI001B7EDB55|nr:uncharacterized protein LOC121255605 [Juglans microcarpa x Juglans regia]